MTKTRLSAVTAAASQLLDTYKHLLKGTRARFSQARALVAFLYRPLALHPTATLQQVFRLFRSKARAFGFTRARPRAGLSDPITHAPLLAPYFMPRSL